MDGMTPFPWLLAETAPRPRSERDDVHVMPNFGREHECSDACWCTPSPLPDTLDRSKYDHTVWVHEVQQ